MEEKTKYFLETTAYGICTIIGISATILFTIQLKLILVILSIIFTLISIDNFFCGSHAKKCGFPIETHYVIPWKIKKQQIYKTTKSLGRWKK